MEEEIKTQSLIEKKAYVLQLKDLILNEDEETIASLNYALKFFFPYIEWLVENSEEGQIDDWVRQLENIIIRTIAHYEKLDFYNTYKTNTEKNKRKYKTLKTANSNTFNALKFRSYFIPYGYYTIAKRELVPAIIFYHMLRLKKRLLKTGDFDYLEETQECFISSVLVPEILTHMIAFDMQIDYDLALEILQDPIAMKYGDFCELDYKHGLIKNHSDYKR